jgi:hypothetical protein
MSRYGLLLKGCEEQSVWGWDEPLSTWYLQLYFNSTDHDDEPDLWLYGRDKCMYPLHLAEACAEYLKDTVSPLEILLAMAEGARGFWGDDGWGDVGTIPRLAEAISYLEGSTAAEIIEQLESNEKRFVGGRYYPFGSDD